MFNRKFIVCIPAKKGENPKFKLFSLTDGFYHAAAPSAPLHSRVHALKTCAAIRQLPPVLYSTSALLCLFYKRCEAASRVQLKHPLKPVEWEVTGVGAVGM